jgi:DNA-binding XRE family transcriptional regulator
VGGQRPLKVYRPAKHPIDLDDRIAVDRGRPRAYLEWRYLRRWGQLPRWERDVPGYRLRLLREQHGLSQTVLARLLGVTQQAVAQAERWVTNPTVSFLRSWATACGRRLALRFPESRERGGAD